VGTRAIVSNGFDNTALVHHFGDGVRAKPAGPHQRARWQSNEAVAAEALAADDGFEQKAVLSAIFAVGQLQV